MSLNTLILPHVLTTFLDVLGNVLESFISLMQDLGVFSLFGSLTVTGDNH